MKLTHGESHVLIAAIITAIVMSVGIFLCETSDDKDILTNFKTEYVNLDKVHIKQNYTYDNGKIKPLTVIKEEDRDKYCVECHVNFK